MLVALAVEIIPNVADTAAIEGTCPLLLIGIAFGGDCINPTGDDTILSCRCNISRDLLPSHWTFSPEKRPFFALPVVLENTNAIFAAIASFLNGQLSALIEAIDRSRLGNAHLAFTMLYAPVSRATASIKENQQQRQSNPDN